MPESGPLFAVTTRSRLKGPWFFPAMFLASRKIGRQLASSPDVVRWASVVVSPSEFWSITVWRDRLEMQEFARSGAHDEIMWRFSKWIDAFWLMRWSPGPVERGTWGGLSMAQPEAEHLAGVAIDRPDLQEVLEYLPRLRAATDATGRATYEASPAVRQQRAEVAGARGVVVYIRSGGLWRRAGLRALRRLRTSLEDDEQVVRSVVGFGRSRDAYLFTVWDGQTGARAFMESTALTTVLEKWPEASWTSEWLPENEFGHWDGLRLRRNRNRHGLRVPQGARDAATLPTEGDIE